MGTPASTLASIHTETKNHRDRTYLEREYAFGPRWFEFVPILRPQV